MIKIYDKLEYKIQVSKLNQFTYKKLIHLNF